MFSTMYQLILLGALITLAQSAVKCRVCRGTVNSVCHLNPEMIPGSELNCPEGQQCTVFGKVYKNGGELQEIQRDCRSRILPIPIPLQYENTCKDDNSHFIKCTHSCGSGDFCNDGISWAPQGWNEDGSQTTGASTQSERDTQYLFDGWKEKSTNRALYYGKCQNCVRELVMTDPINIRILKAFGNEDGSQTSGASTQSTLSILIMTTAAVAAITSLI